MQQKLVILLIVAFLPFYGFSQLQINWQQCYGGSEADGAQNLIKTGNDFIVVGYAESEMMETLVLAMADVTDG